MIVCSLEQIYNERAVQTLKPSSAQKNALREFLVIYIFFIRICLLICPLVFQHLPITADALSHILQSSRQF